MASRGQHEQSLELRSNSNYRVLRLIAAKFRTNFARTTIHYGLEIELLGRALLGIILLTVVEENEMSISYKRAASLFPYEPERPSQKHSRL